MDNAYAPYALWEKNNGHYMLERLLPKVTAIQWQENYNRQDANRDWVSWHVLPEDELPACDDGCDCPLARPRLELAPNISQEN